MHDLFGRLFFFVYTVKFEQIVVSRLNSGIFQERASSLDELGAARCSYRDGPTSSWLCD